MSTFIMSVEKKRKRGNVFGLNGVDGSIQKYFHVVYNIELLKFEIYLGIHNDRYKI